MNFNEIKTSYDVCKELNFDYNLFSNNINLLKIGGFSERLISIYKLELILRSLNGNSFKLFDLLNCNEPIYYPKFSIYRTELEFYPKYSNKLLLNKFYTKKDNKYYYLYIDKNSTTVKLFISDISGVIANSTEISGLIFIGCKSHEIAYHFGKYFYKDIFDLLFKSLEDEIEWEY